MPLKTPKNPTKGLGESFSESIKKHHEFSFVPLNRLYLDRLKVFDCGDDSLNQYAYSFSFQDEKRGLSRTYLGVNDSKDVVSFFSLSCGEIDKGDLPGATKPYHAYPVIRLGRFAVDVRYQGFGYGFDTLVEVFLVYSQIALKTGTIALVVDAYPNKVSFYEKFGFQRLNSHADKGISLYVLTGTISQSAYQFRSR